MKKLLLLLLLAPIFGFTQLNSNAKAIKQKSPELYETIKRFSENKWDDDYQMVVYTINNQIDAFIEMGNLMNGDKFDEVIWFKSLLKWSENPTKVEEELLDGKVQAALTSNIIQWDMVLYTYKNQLEAKLSY